jgi:tRNA(Leu) C34 or U34 (ribose-2'-O)-methylase TrmL
MALLLNLWANKGRLRPEQIKDHSNVDTMNDAAHIQANIEHAEGTNPFSPTNAKEANSHFDALDSAMESALNDELVSLKAPVTGTPKAIVRPGTINTDEHKAPVIADVLTNPVFDKKPWTKTIVQEASKRGINPVDALIISHLETGGTFSTSIQPKDRNGKLLSSATGLFQTLDSTFARMGGKNKFDGNDQIKAGLNYYEHNSKVFRTHFNRDPNGLELYYLHFFGEGGGPAFLRAKDNELFVDVATRWSKGNQKKTARQIAEGITSSHQFNGMTVGQVKAKYEKIYATHLSQDAVSLYDLNLTGSVALLFGNERIGLSPQILQYATGNFIIPMQGMVQSLNISVACAVSLFEVMRQRIGAGLYANPQLPAETREGMFDAWIHREL